MYFSKCLDEGICPIEVVLKTYFIIYDAWPIFWQIIQIFYSVLLNMFNVFCIYCLHLLALVLFMDVSNLKKNPSIFEWTSMHKSVKFSNTFSILKTSINFKYTFKWMERLSCWLSNTFKRCKNKKHHSLFVCVSSY